MESSEALNTTFKLFAETAGWETFVLAQFLIVVVIWKEIKSKTKMNTILLNSGFMHGYCRNCGKEMWYKEYTDICTECKKQLTSQSI